MKSLKKLTPKGTSVLAISSSSGEGIAELLRTVQKQVASHQKPAKKLLKSKLPVISIREDDRSWHIKKSGTGFVVTGKKIESFAQRTRFGDYHGEQRLRDIMNKMGITRELQRRGIKPGNTITIGKPSIGELEY